MPPPPAAAAALGVLRGKLDSGDHRLICGWAQDSADPGRRVGLVASVNGQAIGRMLANRHRADLAEAGIGDGRHAFELVFPNALSTLVAQEIRVRREADGAELPGSPLTLPAATRLDEAVEGTLAEIVAGLAVEDESRALAMLTGEADRLLARRAERQGGRAEREALSLFRRRWGGEEPDQSAQRRGPAATAPRALVVDGRVPCAGRDAGSVAILSHMRALRTLGYAVSFVAADEMRSTAALTRMAEAEGVVPCGAPYYSCVEDVLSRQAGAFDLVYLHRAHSADRYLPLVRRYCPKARILYSVADLHHLRLARQAQVERRPELLARSRQLGAVELLAARRADIVITHSPVEADLLRREVGFGKVHLVPFAAAPRRPRRPFCERRGIAILGSFEHAPNPDAVHHLVSDILPLVWPREPGLACKIVGHGWPADRPAYRDRRIEVVGAVEDLDDLFDTVRLTVAPLRFGAGIKGKVLDSFAAGLPCVMTPIAAEGLPLPAALQDLVGADPAALAQLIARYHADPIANQAAATAATALVRHEFTAERVAQALADALAEQPQTARAQSR